MQPAVGVDGGRGRLRVVQIAHHDVRPAQQHFPVVRNAQLKVGERPPARRRNGHRVVLGAAHRPHPVGLGQPVGGQHDVDVKFGLHALHQHHRHGGRTGDREPQRAQVEVFAGRVIQQALVDGRRARQHGDAVALDGPQRVQRIERHVRDQRGTGLQAGQDAGLVAEVVEERVDAQVAVVAGDLPVGGPGCRGRQRLPVRAQHAFAAAGGAGGEQDVADVLGCDGGGTGCDGIQGPGTRGDELVPGPVVGFDRHPHDVPQRGQRGPVQAGRPVGAQEEARREQHRRAGSVQDVGGFCGGVAGVQRHHRGAGVVDRQAGHHPVPGVRRPDGHPVCGFDTEGDQRRRGAVDRVAQLGRRETPVLGDQRRVVG